MIQFWPFQLILILLEYMEGFFSHLFLLEIPIPTKTDLILTKTVLILLQVQQTKFFLDNAPNLLSLKICFVLDLKT